MSHSRRREIYRRQLTADSRRIVVVGPCASGKSTLVAALRDFGYDARVSAQEHSEIATLWQRSEPDVLVALDVDIEAVHDRRGAHWPLWLHQIQRRRLAHAVARADLRVDTSALDATSMIETVLAFLRPPTPEGSRPANWR
jgi:hypothetical protein